jgi:hypothetical protein
MLFSLGPRPGTQNGGGAWVLGRPFSMILALGWNGPTKSMETTCATNTKHVSNTSLVRHTYNKITKDTCQKYNSNNNHHNKEPMTFRRIPYTFHILFRLVFIGFIFVHTLGKPNLTRLHTQAKYNPPAVKDENKNSKYPSGTCVLVKIRSFI